MKKQDLKKMRSLGTSATALNAPTSDHRSAKRRRTRAKNWKLIWTNNERKLPQSGEGNRLLGSPGSPESPKEIAPKEEHTKHHHNTLAKIKDKERILKAARGKETVTYKGMTHKTISWFLKRNVIGKKGLERSIWSHERQGPTSKITVSNKAII